jgi:hypothetical protein
MVFTTRVMAINPLTSKLITMLDGHRSHTLEQFPAGIRTRQPGEMGYIYISYKYTASLKYNENS